MMMIYDEVYDCSLPTTATAEVVAKRLWLLECQALVRARRKLGHKSVNRTDLAIMAMTIRGQKRHFCKSAVDLQTQPSFHCHLPLFVEAFEALGRWHT